MMQNQSCYLPFVELLIAVVGIASYLYDILIRKVNKNGLIFLLLVLITGLISSLTYDDDRYVIIKAILFLSCLFLSSKYPRQLLSLLALVTFAGYWLDNVVNDVFLSKHVGENANQIITIPFLLIAITFFLSVNKFNRFTLLVLYLIAIFEMFLGIYFDVRNTFLCSVIFILILSSVSLSKKLIKYGQFIPFLYIGIMSLIYINFHHGYEYISYTPSNVERSSMIYAAASNFFGYILKGPGVDFDILVIPLMANISNFQPYSNINGVDPHSFILSFWRDAGTLLCILWISYWFLYWRYMRKVESLIHDARVRIYLGLLAISLVLFSLEPPSCGFRLLVAISMGAALSITNSKILESKVNAKGN